MPNLTLCQAIAREEGFYVPNSRASRNHNPGNLNFAPWEEAYGALLEDPPLNGGKARFAKFPSDGIGFHVMGILLSKDYLGLTLHEALLKWAPPSDGNNTSSYETNVCKWMGVSPMEVLTLELISGPPILGQRATLG
jgi:hypothetical protein